MSNAYQQSGVDIEKGYEAVNRMKKHVGRTMRPEVMNQLGSFGALFRLNNQAYEQPVLVSGTDGVGTKVLLAQASGRLDTIGIDCVAMCVNDILAQGAQPLFFLDYLAVGAAEPEKIEAIVAGVAEGCVQAGAALVGGETAEMPDLYAQDEFDLAGFCVGVADEKNILDGTQVSEGDLLIGLPSSGIHSNGYSLVRKLFFKDNHYDFEHVLSDGQTLLDHLLTPTRIYVQEVLPLVEKQLVKGLAHITGGGFYENVPRMFNKPLTAVIDTQAWETPLIFQELQNLGKITFDEMFNIFNMGMGMVMAVSPENSEAVLSQLPDAVVIGKMAKQTTNDEVVHLLIKEEEA
ncbi:phosphoribosylformylglycinamidine cyclo-ligase [Aerococcaceae bacterium DSM 109653]|uniref:Phosphoribosylformylglycinamidine cyclo-ligase n=1 Tax=Fundicoccus ignavus TaxID=2664442 RepID=A0A6I2GNX8_9LACT|nr:phosphoribosylformylglycinamidine cyclo-ligase [Fundicoccus ignavus]MRI81909.1 phosphoribosylformylglycinamidine cyclo-ligase [Fundicoccus ignavus]MRI85225.1 phosphoribosylformylglycinamidine cyclo-ligase [Fundicoccus ignavus]